MEEIDEASAGDVVAIFGVECASMDSFVSGEKRGESSRLAMASMARATTSHLFSGGAEERGASQCGRCLRECSTTFYKGGPYSQSAC